MIPRVDADFLRATAKRIEARANEIAREPHVVREVASARRRMSEYRFQKAIKKLESV